MATVTDESDLVTVTEESDLDLSAFMDVVRLMSCRLCPFKTTNQKEFKEHVRNEHMVAEPQTSKSQGLNGGSEAIPTTSVEATTPCSPQSKATASLAGLVSSGSPPMSPIVASTSFSTAPSTSGSVQLGSSPSKSARPLIATVEAGVARGMDSDSVLAVDGAGTLQTQSMVLSTAGGGEVEEGVNYLLMPKELAQRQQVGELIQLQMPEGVLAEAAGPGATSIGIGDIQVSPQQIQQILEATKTSAMTLPASGGSQISLIPVSVGGQGGVAVAGGSGGQQQFAILASEDGQVLSLGSPVLSATDPPTSLAVKSDQLYGDTRPKSREDGWLLGLGDLLESSCVATATTATSAAQSSAATTTQEIVACGDCHTSFASKRDFLHHVKVNHPDSNMLALSSALKNPPEARLPRGHSTSVGTQIYRKKPGRKRKSEMAVKVEQEDAADDSDDEDWRPGISESGRRKRKARAPRGLREDYYLEDNKQKRRRQAERQNLNEEYTLRCSVMGCLVKFRTQEGLELHTACHNTQDHHFTCTVCQRRVEYWKNLRLHLWREHKLDADLYKCSSCDFRTDTCHKLGVHAEIHSDTRSYTCHECGKGFKQFSQMRNHEVTHSSRQSTDPNKWYSNKKCDICHRIFANSKCLKKHILAVHSKDKPFSCPHCSHRTSRKAMIELHIRTHTGEKPFQCDVCPYASGDHNSLRRHKMRHTGEHKYSCLVCNYTCIQAISLKTHMMSKHPGQGGIFVCNQCSFRTVNEQSFRNHQSDHQNGIVTTHSRRRNSARSSGVEQQQQQSRQLHQQQASVVMVAEDGGQVSEMQQVLEVPGEAMPLEAQLSVMVRHDGTTTLSEQEYRRLVQLEPVLELSAQHFLQYAMAAISAAAASSDCLPSQLRMTLPSNNLQVNISSTESSEGVNHLITLAPLNPAVQRVEMQQQEEAAAPEGEDSGAMEEVGSGSEEEEEEGEEGQQPQVLFTSQTGAAQLAAVAGLPQGGQVEGQVLYISQDTGQPNGTTAAAVLAAQGQQQHHQNVMLEFAMVANGDREAAGREPGVVSMGTETVQMDGIESCTLASDAADVLAASPNSS